MSVVLGLRTAVQSIIPACGEQQDLLTIAADMLRAVNKASYKLQ